MNTEYTPAYGGFWRRFFAYLLDALVITFATGLIFYPLGLDITGSQDPIFAVFQTMGSMLYFSLMESSPLQATIGKLALHLKVTDLSGSRISFARALGRNVSKIFSAFILMIGFLVIAFTRRKQGLHDYITDCLVLCRCAPEASTEALPAPEVHSLAEIEGAQADE